MKNLQSFNAHHIMLLLVIGLALFIYGMRGVQTSAAAPLPSGPPPCPISCQAPNGGTMTKIEWTGRINRIEGDIVITDPRPTFSFRIGYTGSIGPAKVDFGGSKFYRFDIGAGGNENLTWCYSYRGVRFTTMTDSFPPAQAMTVDVHIDNFENRRLLSIQFYAVSAGATNIIDYVSPLVNTFLPETPTFPDRILLDPAKWGGIGYTLASGQPGTNLYGIPNTSNGVITTSACPVTGGLTVTMNSTGPNPTATSPIPVNVQFSESVTGFTASDIVVGNATVGNFTAVDGDIYTLELTPLGPGLVTADILANVAQSVSTNSNNIAALQFSRTFSPANDLPTIVNGACQTITLPTSLANGARNRLYTQSVAASPSGSYSYAVTEGMLPPGVTLFGSAGLLFGYPTMGGTYNFTITATNGGCTGSRSYTVTVAP